jgi:hypothetical protein
MKLELKISSEFIERLSLVAQKRGVSIEALAEAYVEDWLSVEYAELKGRLSRRSMYRDGPIAFDSEAKAAADRIELDLLEKHPSH